MKPTALDDDLAALGPMPPRHVDLARTLMAEIRQGRPALGELLPTEAELCATWGLSRYAVRQAIQKLCALGMVTRQAGIGTRVVADRPQTRYVQAMDGLGDLARYAQGTTLQAGTRRRIRADETQATLLRCPVGARWLHIEGVRYGGESAKDPIALVDIYVDAEHSQIPRLAQALDIPVYSMIEQHYGIKVTRVEQEIQGLMIEGDDAQALQVPDPSPGLRIIRSYFVGEQVIEVTTGVHPASRFSYCTTIQLAPGSGTS